MSQAWVRSPATCFVKDFFYRISIMPPISTNDSDIFWLIKNEKINNNVVGCHLVSLRVTLTPSDTQRMYRCPKRTLLLPKKDIALISKMLLYLLKCFIKRGNCQKLERPNIEQFSCKVLGQRLYHAPSFY